MGRLPNYESPVPTPEEAKGYTNVNKHTPTSLKEYEDRILDTGHRALDRADSAESRFQIPDIQRRAHLANRRVQQWPREAHRVAACWRHTIVTILPLDTGEANMREGISPSLQRVGSFRSVVVVLPPAVHDVRKGSHVRRTQQARVVHLREVHAVNRRKVGLAKHASVHALSGTALRRLGKRCAAHGGTRCEHRRTVAAPAPTPRPTTPSDMGVPKACSPHCKETTPSATLTSRTRASLKWESSGENCADSSTTCTAMRPWVRRRRCCAVTHAEGKAVAFSGEASQRGHSRIVLLLRLWAQRTGSARGLVS